MTRLFSAFLLVSLFSFWAPVEAQDAPEPSPAEPSPAPEGASSAGSSPWSSDYKAAVPKARESDKMLFLLFTGTGWIEICDAFDEKIADVPAFYEPVSEKFLLVKLDFPEDNRLPKDQAVVMQLLRDAYRVRGFPTVVLTDPDGRPFGLNGFQPISAEEYAEQILGMEEVAREKFAKLEAAKSLEGTAKAEALIAGIPDLPGNLAARYYAQEMADVIKSDSEGLFPESELYRALLADVAYSNEMQRLGKTKNWDEMVRLTDQYITEFALSGPALQKALLNKAGVQNNQGDKEAVEKTLAKVVEINPDSPYAQEAQRLLSSPPTEADEEPTAEQ